MKGKLQDCSISFNCYFFLMARKLDETEETSQFVPKATYIMTETLGVTVAYQGTTFTEVTCLFRAVLNVHTDNSDCKFTSYRQSEKAHSEV